MTKRRAPRILVTAGGTGGHVYPALAIADAARAADPTAVIEFAGTRNRMEWEAVPRGGYAIHPVEAAGFARGHVVSNLSVPFKVGRGVAQAWRLVGDFDADVVVSTGGYVTGPVGFAAAVRRRPLLVQEQNAQAGITNRWLGRVASRIHVAFPESAGAFPVGKVTVSGNPIRAGIAGASRRDARALFGLEPDWKILFVFGGSLGSQSINEALSTGLPELLSDPKIRVIWQTGPRYFDRQVAAGPLPDSVRLLAYIDRMDLAYAAADLALCRAGAITCSELLASGTPSILVPSPNVAEDHQTRNAEAMVRMGAARLLPESGLSSGWVGAVRELMDDESARMRMREAAARHAVTDAAERIAGDVLELADRRRS